MLEVPWRAVLPANNQSINHYNQLLLCIIYRINLHQYYKINMRREIHVAYGYEKNKKYVCGNHNYLECLTTHKHSKLPNVNLTPPATIYKNTKHVLINKYMT